MESLTLPASIELRGTGKFESVEDQQWIWPSASSSASTVSAVAASNIHVLSLASHVLKTLAIYPNFFVQSSLKMPRGLVSAKKKDQYTLIIDFCLESLPAYPGRQVHCLFLFIT